MLRELLKLAAVAGLVAAIVGTVGAVARRRTPGSGGLRLVTVALVAITGSFALADLHGAGSAFRQARRDGTGPQAGRDHCFDETNGEPGPRLALRRPFAEWLRTRLPAGASYAVAPYAGPPDPWCLALALLPALPAAPGRTTGWLITFGSVPPDLAGRIARHDPGVEVFAPGFAVERVARR